MTTGRINQVTEIAEATTGDELPGLDWTGGGYRSSIEMTTTSSQPTSQPTRQLTSGFSESDV